MRKKVHGVSERALARFTARARQAAGLDGRVDVLITSSAAIRGLNRRFRGKDRPTDVLSFPPANIGPAAASSGDIAISSDIAAANAARFGHSLADELKVLILHGVLHLAGYNHESDQGQMAREERRLRLALRLPASLIARSSGRLGPDESRRPGGLVRAGRAKLGSSVVGKRRRRGPGARRRGRAR